MTEVATWMNVQVLIAKESKSEKSNSKACSMAFWKRTKILLKLQIFVPFLRKESTTQNSRRYASVGDNQNGLQTTS